MSLSEKDRRNIKQIVDEDRKSMEYLATYGSPVTQMFAQAFILVADGKV